MKKSTKPKPLEPKVNNDIVTPDLSYKKKEPGQYDME